MPLSFWGDIYKPKLKISRIDPGWKFLIFISNPSKLFPNCKIKITKPRKCLFSDTVQQWNIPLLTFKDMIYARARPWMFLRTFSAYSMYAFHYKHACVCAGSYCIGYMSCLFMSLLTWGRKINTQGCANTNWHLCYSHICVLLSIYYFMPKNRD